MLIQFLLPTPDAVSFLVNIKCDILFLGIYTVVPETSSTKLTCTPCKTPKSKYQHALHGESLKLRIKCEVAKLLKTNNMQIK
jgi:hypothetical protein